MAVQYTQGKAKGVSAHRESELLVGPEPPRLFELLDLCLVLLPPLLDESSARGARELADDNGRERQRGQGSRVTGHGGLLRGAINKHL